MTGQMRPLNGAGMPAPQAAGESTIPPVPPGVDAKTWRVEQTKKLINTGDSKTSLSDNLAGMAQTYLALNNMGAITNPDRGVVENILARGGASAVGQTIGGAIGSEAQSLRERINNMQPLLIQSIRQATGMSARAMDSNRELQFYLQAASDPTKDIYSNLAAIDVLDRTYGLGNVLQSVLPPEIYQRVRTQADGQMRQRPLRGMSGDQAPGGYQRVPQPGAIEDGYRFKGGNPADPNSWEQVN